MKKFLIVSIILILVGAIAFGASLYHYIDVTKGDSTPDQVAPTNAPTEEATQAELKVDLPDNWQDNGIFSDNYEKAYAYMQDMSTEQMVGQLLIGSCPTDDSAKSTLSKYALSGYVYTADNFFDMTAQEIKSTIADYQSSASTAMIMAVEEEGGAVTALSDLDAYPEYDFYPIREVFAQGGMEAVENDETQKAQLLSSVGINVNLAPVCDMAGEFTQIMYSRSLGGTVQETSQYASSATQISQNKGVSVALKHFPGYGTIEDSFEAVKVDTRDVQQFEQNDFKPFEAGIDAGAHMVMMSNVLVEKMDPRCIASLSDYVHTVLRDELKFTGLIITDNLDYYDEFSDFANNKSVYVQAVLAGNDLVMVDDVETAYKDILSAVNDGTIDEDTVQRACMRVLAYKYTAGILN